jgi:hypothetical protein
MVDQAQYVFPPQPLFTFRIVSSGVNSRHQRDEFWVNKGVLPQKLLSVSNPDRGLPPFTRLAVSFSFDPIEKKFLLGNPLLDEPGNPGLIKGCSNLRLLNPYQRGHPGGAIVLQLKSIPGLRSNFDFLEELLVRNT